MRKIVFGDIHGRLEALQQVIDSISPTENDEFIFLGDYVDKGDKTCQTLNYLIEFNKKYNCIFIRGNHDQWFLDCFNSSYGFDLNHWLTQGGKQTLNSYPKDEAEFNTLVSSHMDFLNNTILYHIDDDNIGYVHGGFVSKKGLGHDVHKSNYYWDRDLWELAILNDKELETVKSTRFYQHKELYIGHSPTINWKLKRHYPEYKYCKDQAKSKHMIKYIVSQKCFNQKLLLFVKSVCPIISLGHF